MAADPGFAPEIEVREFLRVLWRRKVTFLTVPALLTLAIAYVSWPTGRYEAAAGVLEMPRVPPLEFALRGGLGDQQVLLQPEQEPSLVSRPREPTERLGTLLSELVDSTGVAARVYERYQRDNPGVYDSVDDLLELIESRTIERSRLLWIVAETGDPAGAMELANVWAEEYEAFVNGVLVAPAARDNDEADDQLAALKSRHDAAQQAYVGYLESQQIPALEARIADVRVALDGITARRRDALARGADDQMRQLAERYGQERADGRLFGTSPGAEALLRELNALEADLEAQRAELKELQRDRDLTWHSYSALARELAEVELNEPFRDPQAVRFVSPAITPTSQIPRAGNTIYVLFLSIVVGTLGAVGLAFFREYAISHARD